MIIDSKRAGGKYLILHLDESMLHDGYYGLTDREKAVISTWIANKNRLGLNAEVSNELIQQVKNRELKPMNPYHRADALLRIMVGKYDSGEFVRTASLLEDPEILIHTESADEDDGELLVDSLVERKLLHEGGGRVRVSLAGYQRIAELDAPNTESRQVFVAMWFNDATVALRHTIKQAVEGADLVPYFIDEDPSFQNKICDKIEIEIRRSRMLIADFSHGDDGARGSVYYEAGLAKGLGLPVVWTCCKPQIKDLHFDINHYPHLDWQDAQLPDFRERLTTRLRLLVAES